MSHLTLVQLFIPSAVMLVKTLVETGLECVQRSDFQTEDGKTHAVDVVVKDPASGAQVGVRLVARNGAKNGGAEFVAFDCKSGGAKGKALGQAIVQRYAAARVREELRKKGYQLQQEQTRADGTLQLTAQRWK